jgi:hypothetical protein
MTQNRTLFVQPFGPFSSYRLTSLLALLETEESGLSSNKDRETASSLPASNDRFQDSASTKRARWEEVIEILDQVLAILEEEDSDV